MTLTRGVYLAVEAEVPETHDVGKGTGYMVKKTLTIEGTPGEAVILGGIWAALEEAGELPVWARVTLTWSGREWPWTQIISKFDVEYQAVHMAEGSILATIAAVILYALPYLASILLVLLAWKVVTYFILKIEDVAEWLDKYGPQVGTGIGIGLVLLVILILLGSDKK